MKKKVSNKLILIMFGISFLILLLITILAIYYPHFCVLIMCNLFFILLVFAGKFLLKIIKLVFCSDKSLSKLSILFIAFIVNCLLLLLQIYGIYASYSDLINGPKMVLLHDVEMTLEKKYSYKSGTSRYYKIVGKTFDNKNVVIPIKTTKGVNIKKVKKYIKDKKENVFDVFYVYYYEKFNYVTKVE